MGMSELFDEVKLTFSELAYAFKHDRKEFVMDFLGAISILLVVYTMLLLGSVKNG
jgi:hypothetical protein